MAGTERYEVHGLKELNQALKKFPVNVERRMLRSIAGAGGQVVVKAAKQNVPVASGDLKKGIIRRSKKGAKIPSRVVVSVGASTEVFYGMFLEFGTVKMPATPWLRPALDDNIIEIVAAMKKRAGKRIEAEAKKAAKESGMRRLR